MVISHNCVCVCVPYCVGVRMRWKEACDNLNGIKVVSKNSRQKSSVPAWSSCWRHLATSTVVSWITQGLTKLVVFVEQKKEKKKNERKCECFTLDAHKESGNLQSGSVEKGNKIQRIPKWATEDNFEGRSLDEWEAEARKDLLRKSEKVIFLVSSSLRTC